MLELQLALNSISLADAETPDSSIDYNALVEGIFLRAFTYYENFLEAAFLKYCIGEAAIDGFQPVCRLANCTEAQALAISKNGQRYLDWSNAADVRARADLFFLDGEPFRFAIDPRTAVLSEIEKIRNHIAHQSRESRVGYMSTQRALFATERIFDMSPGHLLRTRRKKVRPPTSQCAHYISAMHDAARAVARA